MATKNVAPIIIENARLIFRNFEGRKGPFNEKGARSVTVLLTDEQAKQAEQDGWNVKYLRPQNEGDPPRPSLAVKVKFGRLPPRIVLITGQGKTAITEDTAALLDWVEIDNADITIRAYTGDINGEPFQAAYLKTLYLTAVEDEFERKYYDVPSIDHIPEEL